MSGADEVQRKPHGYPEVEALEPTSPLSLVADLTGPNTPPWLTRHGNMRKSVCPFLDYSCAMAAYQSLGPYTRMP